MFQPTDVPCSLEALVLEHKNWSATYPCGRLFFVYTTRKNYVNRITETSKRKHGKNTQPIPAARPAHADTESTHRRATTHPKEKP